MGKQKIYIGANSIVASKGSPNISIIYSSCKKVQDVVFLYLTHLIFRGIKVEGQMDTCFTINVPASLSMESADELYRASLKNLQGISWVIFDFGKVTFVTPRAIILVVTASRFWCDRFNHAVEWKNINSNVLSYMDRMNVSELDFIDIERPSLFKRKNYQKSDVLVELSVIKDIQQASSAIRKTKEILDCWLPSSHKMCKFNLATLIKETVENSIEHSSADLSNGSCYYLLQKYGFPDGSTQIQIAVGDAGVGMLTSQRRVYPATKDDAEALINAVMYGKSGRKTGGGMGYVTIRESLGPLKGKILVRSGRAHIVHAAGQPYASIYRHSCFSPGTQIVFECNA